MAQQLRPSKSASKKPKIDWSRREEADNFAHTVKLYRQGKIDHDSFRRFRLQHGAYGTRMTDDYAMVRIKIPAGQIYPHQLEKIAQLSEMYSIGSAHVSTRENVQLHWVILEDVSEIMHGLADVGLTSSKSADDLFFFDSEGWDITRKLILKLKQEVQENEGELAVIHFGGLHQYRNFPTLPLKQFDAFLESEGISHFNTFDLFLKINDELLNKNFTK